MARAQNYHVNIDRLVLQTVVQSCLVYEVNEVGKIFFFKAETALLFAFLVDFEVTVAHDDENARVLPQQTIEALVVERLAADRQFFLHLAHSFHDAVKHGVRLDDVALRHCHELVRHVLEAEGISVGKEDVRTQLSL